MRWDGCVACNLQVAWLVSAPASPSAVSPRSSTKAQPVSLCTWSNKLFSVQGFIWIRYFLKLAERAEPCTRCYTAWLGATACTRASTDQRWGHSICSMRARATIALFIAAARPARSAKSTESSRGEGSTCILVCILLESLEFFLSIFRFWVICWVMRTLRFCRMACEHGEAGEDGAARGGAADGPRIHESLEMGELLVIYSVILCCYYCHQFNLYCVLMISVLLILKLHVTVLPIYNATCWHFWVLGWI